MAVFDLRLGDHASISSITKKTINILIYNYLSFSFLQLADFHSYSWLSCTLLLQSLSVSRFISQSKKPSVGQDLSGLMRYFALDKESPYTLSDSDAATEADRQTI